MKVLTDSIFTKDQIKKIENHYAAKFVLDTCLRGRDGQWLNWPAAIFYTDQPHPDGSNYFAFYRDPYDDGLRIADGKSAVEGVVFEGVEAEGDVVYSRYRHDYRTHKNGLFIDGGRDYTRYGGDTYGDYHIVHFEVKDGEIQFVDWPPVPDVDYHLQEFN